MIKYIKDNNCPIKIKGSSTGRMPIQVNNKIVEINNQKISFLKG